MHILHLKDFRQTPDLRLEKALEKSTPVRVYFIFSAKLKCSFICNIPLSICGKTLSGNDLNCGARHCSPALNASRENEAVLSMVFSRVKSVFQL